MAATDGSGVNHDVKPTWRRKYHWVLTWPGEEKEDWSAYHDGLCIGRVSRDRTSLKRGMFLWSGNCSAWGQFQRPMPHSGRCVEAWEAAKAVEDWYDEGLARSGERPESVARKIGPLDANGLPVWLERWADGSEQPLFERRITGRSR